jgi:serine protease Do
VILGVDGKSMLDNSEISRYIASRPPNSTVKLQVYRDGSERTLSVTLGTFPEQDVEAEESREGRAQLGMTLRDLTPGLADQLELPRGTRGVVVSDVEAGGAAENATPPLQRGDVIVSVNGAAVASVDEFESEIERAGKDGLARLRVRRGENQLIAVLRIP